MLSVSYNDDTGDETNCTSGAIVITLKDEAKFIIGQMYLWLDFPSDQDLLRELDYDRWTTEPEGTSFDMCNGCIYMYYTKDWLSLELSLGA